MEARGKSDRRQREDTWRNERDKGPGFMRQNKVLRNFRSQREVYFIRLVHVDTRRFSPTNVAEGARAIAALAAQERPRWHPVRRGLLNERRKSLQDKLKSLLTRWLVRREPDVWAHRGIEIG